MIAQLKAENFEYRQKEKDYNILHSQLLDLEHRFRLLQEEKARGERDARDREDQNYKRNESLQSEIKVVKASIDEKQKQLKELGAELAALKELAGDKTDEISHLKQEIAAANVTADDLVKDKRALEDECAFEADKKKAVQFEINKYLSINDQISKEKALSESKIRENEVEARRLSDQIDLINRQITDTHIIARQKEAELSTALDTKKNIQHEIDDLILANSRLQDENKTMGLKARDLELEVDRLNKRLDETLTITDVRDKELRAAKSNLAYSEDKVTETKEQAKKIQRENEVLQALLDKYRNDVEMHKHLRNQEISKKLEIEQEKKRLEREVLHKDLEARSAKKELEKVQVDKDRLLDNHAQLNQELDALREHAGLLEQQNKTVCPTFLCGK